MPAPTRAVVAWILYAVVDTAYDLLHVSGAALRFFPGQPPEPWDPWRAGLRFLSLVPLLVTPWLGLLIDRRGLHRIAFITTAVVMVLPLMVLATISFVLGSHTDIVLLWVIVVVSVTAVLPCITLPYSAYLPLVSSPSTVGRVAGGAFALGLAAPILFLLALFVPTMTLRHLYPLIVFAPLVLGPAIAITAILCLPRVASRATRAPGVSQDLFAGWRAIAGGDLRYFLLASFAAALGLELAIALVAASAVRLAEGRSDLLPTVLAAGVVAGVMGALAYTLPLDRLGPRRALMLALGAGAAVAMLATMAETSAHLHIVTGVGALVIGTGVPARRALLARLVPTGMEVEMFGWDTLLGGSAATIAWTGVAVFPALFRGPIEAPILGTATFVLIAGSLLIALLLITLIGGGSTAPPVEDSVGRQPIARALPLPPPPRSSETPVPRTSDSREV